MDYTKLCKDCRFSELGDVIPGGEEAFAWVCSHPSSRKTGTRSVVNGETPEPWQAPCMFARWDEDNPRRCGPEGRHWEQR